MPSSSPSLTEQKVRKKSKKKKKIQKRPKEPRVVKNISSRQNYVKDFRFSDILK